VEYSWRVFCVASLAKVVRRKDREKAVDVESWKSCMEMTWRAGMSLPVVSEVLSDSWLTSLDRLLSGRGVIGSSLHGTPRASDGRHPHMRVRIANETTLEPHELSSQHGVGRSSESTRPSHLFIKPHVKRIGCHCTYLVLSISRTLPGISRRQSSTHRLLGAGSVKTSQL
jgi:hypothetical protein